MEILYEEPVSSRTLAAVPNPVDKLWTRLREEYPNIALLEVHFSGNGRKFKKSSRVALPGKVFAQGIEVP